jgi:hypothetical protein
MKKPNTSLIVMLSITIVLLITGIILFIVYGLKETYKQTSNSKSTSELDENEDEFNDDKFRRCGPDCAKCNDTTSLIPNQFCNNITSSGLIINPNACSYLTPSQISLIPENSLKMLQTDADGRYIQCNRSCSQPITACGLDSSDLYIGVL